MNLSLNYFPVSNKEQHARGGSQNEDFLNEINRNNTFFFISLIYFLDVWIYFIIWILEINHFVVIFVTFWRQFRGIFFILGINSHLFIGYKGDKNFEIKQLYKCNLIVRYLGIEM